MYEKQLAMTTGAWLESHDRGARKFIKIGSLLLENGETLPDVTIAYQSWGSLNTPQDNAILVNHAMTGWSDVPAWWPSMVGPGLPFDSDQYFVVCPNVIGGCQGSTGPSSVAPDGKRWGSRFPALTIRDMVAAEVAFSDAIGVKKYKGSSLEEDLKKVGDKVCVIYLGNTPSINKPITYFDKREIKCNCDK